MKEIAHIVFVSALNVIMCFHVVHKENNDYKETDSMNLSPIQQRSQLIIIFMFCGCLLWLFKC